MAVLHEHANDATRATATFNLKAVVQETGLKPDTLRAWERRYGIPNPDRTAGGHRLYSQDDIHLLKWLVARQEEGLSISRAVDLWQRLLDDSKNPFKELPVESAEEGPIVRNVVPVGATLIQMREAWIEACMAFQEQSAENILNQAFSMYSPELVCFELLQHALSDIGHNWYEGKVTVQQEHFASGLARRRIEALLVGAAPPTRVGRILISCAPEEEHTYSSMLLTLLLRRRGWEATYLGANVPMSRLEATIAAIEPKIVILTAQTLPTAATLLSMAELFRKQGLMVAFGGLVFTRLPLLIQRIPGHYLGDTLQGSPQTIEQLLNTPRPIGHVVLANATYRDATRHFTERRAKLEATVVDLLRDEEIRPSILNAINYDLSRHISAALSLGDLTFLGTKIAEIEELLVGQYQRVTRDIFPRFFASYAAATARTLDDRGKIIVNWFTTILDNATD